MFGQPVTLTASVITAAGSTAPTGKVTFKDGSKTLGTAKLDSSGQASISVATLSTSSHAITAVYAGDGSSLISTGTMTEAVGKAATTTGSAALPASSLVGQPVTFTATVAVVGSGAGKPTGTVTFYDGGSKLARRLR